MLVSNVLINNFPFFPFILVSCPAIGAIPKCTCLHPAMCHKPLRSIGALDGLFHRLVVLVFPAGLLAVLGQAYGCVGRGSPEKVSPPPGTSLCGLMFPCEGPGWCQSRVIYRFHTSYCTSAPGCCCRWAISHTA